MHDILSPDQFLFPILWMTCRPLLFSQYFKYSPHSHLQQITLLPISLKKRDVTRREIAHFSCCIYSTTHFWLIRCPCTKANPSSWTLVPPSFASLRFCHQFPPSYWIIMIMSKHMVILLTVQNNPFFILVLLLLSHYSRLFYNKTPRKKIAYTITSGHPQILLPFTPKSDCIAPPFLILSWSNASYFSLGLL